MPKPADKRFHLFFVHGPDSAVIQIWNRKRFNLGAVSYTHLGDTELEIDFAMSPHFVRADPRVRADIGKIAIVRGPEVYCLEGCDEDVYKRQGQLCELSFG